MIKKCKYCGARFDAKTTWQEYCKDAHRVADYRKNQKQQQNQTTTPQQSAKPSQ
jgi:hypothetical protein